MKRIGEFSNIQRTLALLLCGAIGTTTLAACGPEDGQQSNPAATEAAPQRGGEAGEHNRKLTIGQDGQRIECLSATFTRSGGSIVMHAEVVPPGAQGLTTEYAINSSTGRHEGSFLGTGGSIDSAPLGKNARGWLTIHFPFGDRSSGSDYCNGQSIEIPD